MRHRAYRFRCRPFSGRDRPAGSLYFLLIMMNNTLSVLATVLVRIIPGRSADVGNGRRNLAR
jgi:hypothetical protein